MKDFLLEAEDDIEDWDGEDLIDEGDELDDDVLEERKQKDY